MIAGRLHLQSRADARRAAACCILSEAAAWFPDSLPSFFILSPTTLQARLIPHLAKSSTNTMSTDPKAYKGSCHCGLVQYQIRLKFPTSPKPEGETISIYKCNCSTCQKMGFFHCRPITPAEDFILISPTNIKELGDYRVYTKTNGWYFCKQCGVRVFGIGAKWGKERMDVEAWGRGEKGDQGDEKDMQVVLKTMPTTKKRVVDGEEVEKPYHYVSVNAVTLEPNEDTDLKKWHENGWIMYVDCRARKEPAPRFGEPFEGGMY
jgi:hypothetical protein